MSHESALIDRVAGGRSSRSAVAIGARSQRSGPLSYIQRGIWLSCQVARDLPVYVLPAGYWLRGDLDVDVLRRALEGLVVRHAALRTVIESTSEGPVQTVRDDLDLDFEYVDASARAADGVDELVSSETRRPFTFERGPLFRARLLRISDRKHLLLLLMHHVIGDGWSIGLLFRELDVLYQAFSRGERSPLRALPIEYIDYALWQRERLSGQSFEDLLGYWRDQLKDAPARLELPTDHARPSTLAHRTAKSWFTIPAALRTTLAGLAQKESATLYMVLLSAFNVWLGRYSSQRDIVVGTPVANRRPSEVEGLVGCFVNTLALRTTFSDDPSFRELLQRVRTTTLGALARQDLPFERLVENLRPERSLSHTSVFQVMFAFQNVPVQTKLGTLTVEPLMVDLGAGAFDLALSLHDGPAGTYAVLRYSTDLFERSTVEQMGRHYVHLLESIAADSDRRISQLDMLEPAESRQLLVTWNATDATYAPRSCVPDLFEVQAERTPDAVAVAYESEQLTYAEVNRRANRLAHALIGHGVKPDVIVAICMERSTTMVVALLGVLKAGGAYVPLDPSYPVDRLRHMLSDCGAVAVLTQHSLGTLLGPIDVPMLDAEAAIVGPTDGPTTNPPRNDLSPDHLAYVIYTSGSTGQPKGVMNQHRCLVNRLRWAQTAWPLTTHDTLLGKTSLGFDGSVRELLWPLTAGARIVLARPDGHRDPDYLLTMIQREQVTTLNLVPSMLQVLLDQPALERSGTVTRVLCGGEALSSALVRQLRERLPHVSLHNLYGPSEAATATALLDCEKFETGTAVPIGCPIGNTRIYILDDAGAPVPVGVPGELYIGGVGVARGYIGHPARTAERFVPDALGGTMGGRLYRTGDLGRWRPDATIEFLGRTDAQVKVRGFRIELGEIEAWLKTHAGVRDAVVAARDRGQGDQQLVAYWVGEGDVDAEALRAHLRARVPEYMAPAAYVRLERLPLTTSGKVDRRALPAPNDAAYARGSDEPPTSAVEVALAAIWAEVLGVARIGRWDDFFALGGHSLLAVKVVSRVRQVLGIEMPLGYVFLYPVLVDCARALPTAARAKRQPIEPGAPQDHVPLSFAQQRLWFLDRMGSAGRAYHISKRLRLRGSLNGEALQRALHRIVARHDALRTTFRVSAGQPEQWIAPPEECGFALREHDMTAQADVDRALQRLVQDEAETPFDLATGPLIRGRLVRVRPDDHVLLLTMHHIVSDGWSVGILYNELNALYRAFTCGEPDPLPPLSIQYADYAVWQRRWATTSEPEHGAYWKQRLAGAPEVLALPTDAPRTNEWDDAAAVVPLELGAALTVGLKVLSRRRGTTLFMTVLAGWATVVSRLSRQADVVIGTPVANRGRQEIEGLIGFFVNMLALRLDLSGSPSVAELLQRVKERTLEAQQHQDLPFEQVVELVQPVRTMAHSPLFQTVFAWQNTREGDLTLPGLDVSRVEGRPTTPFDLALSLSEAGDRIRGVMVYATARFHHDTATRYAEYLRQILAEMVADDRQRIDRLALLPADERAQLVQAWNATDAPSPGELCVHAGFEAQVLRTPEAVAVVYEGEQVTYGALNRRANQLAHALIERGVGPDTRVAICVERSPAMVVGLLAVLKAGGAYVPLDPTYPLERLRYMLDDSGAVALLTHRAVTGLLTDADVPVLTLDAAGEDWTNRDADNPRSAGLTPDHLAYVIYTSGSTGQPKGVMNPHRSVVNMLAWSQDQWTLGAGEAVLQGMPFSFDVSVRELFWPLTVGGRLVLARPEGHKDPSYVVDTIRREQIGFTHCPPSMLAVVLDHPDIATCGSVSRVVTGGEPLSSSLIVRFNDRLPHATLYSEYGPTEATVTVTGHCFTRDQAEHPRLIGRPKANARIYVLDDAGEPVPVGVVGELHIGGAQLARGYVDRPEPTAERFIPDPFAAEPGARLYRTGDLGRWMRDGTIEFVGRDDDQIKVRGHRIETGEIEARLTGHASVRDAVVVVREDASGDQQLVAYCVGDPVAAETLRAHLTEALPQYMVPSAYVRLPSLPLQPNGKVDRAALPPPAADAFATRGYEAPVGETETTLAAMWVEVLGIEQVGRHDHFFDLGGHSLLATRLLVRINTQIGANIALRDIFETPVLSGLAARVLEAQLARFDSAELAALLPESGTIH